MRLKTKNNLRAATAILSVVVLLSLGFWVELLAEEKPPVPKRVLALFLFQHGRMPWTYRLEENLRLALAENPSRHIELDVEHAAHSRFSEKGYCSRIFDMFQKKYANRKVDLVLSLGDETSDLVLEKGVAMFGEVPMVLVTSAQKKLVA
ncbi:MAG: hypothetical protein U9N63_07810 [Pseudomonadota bacterium]|nr:hypothetical protein [Pseudomonadota bacterium]